MGVSSKRFPTEVTFVRLILTVHSAMDCHAAAVAKRFLTVVTSARLILGVHLAVSYQDAPLRKFISTFVTIVGAHQCALRGVLSGCSDTQKFCHSRHNCRVYPQSALGGEMLGGPGH